MKYFDMMYKGRKGFWKFYSMLFLVWNVLHLVEILYRRTEQARTMNVRAASASVRESAARFVISRNFTRTERLMRFDLPVGCLLAKILL